MLIYDDIQGGGKIGGGARELIRDTRLYDYANARFHDGRVDEAADRAAERGCPLVLNLEGVRFPLTIERAQERLSDAPSPSGTAEQLRVRTIEQLADAVARIRARQPGVTLAMWSDNYPPLYGGKVWSGPNWRLAGKTDQRDAYRAQCDELLATGVADLFDWCVVTAYTYFTDDGTTDPRTSAWHAMTDFFIETALRFGKPINLYIDLDYRGSVYQFKPRRERADLANQPIQPEFMRRKMYYADKACDRGLIHSVTPYLPYSSDLSLYEPQIAVVREFL